MFLSVCPGTTDEILYGCVLQGEQKVQTAGVFLLLLKIYCSIIKPLENIHPPALLINRV